jgi:NADH-quinone oxidoreductase subunit L
MGRLIFLTFFGHPRMSHEVEDHIHESPRSMTVPLIVLAFFSVTAGWLGWPASLGGSNRFEKFLEPVFTNERVEAAGEHGPPAEQGSRGVEYGLMILSIGAAAAGLAFAHRSYRWADKGYKEPISVSAPPVYRVLFNKYFVDEGYDYLFTGRRKLGPVRLGAIGAGDASSWVDTNVIDGTVNAAGWMTRFTGTVSKWWDKWIIDGVGVNGPALALRALSYPMRLVQWGLVQWYALVMVLGLTGFIWYYAFR